jgi:DNA-binding transcriptional ArsR family regulator
MKRSRPSRSSPTRHAPLGESMLAEVALRFRALAEPARLRLLQSLRDGPRSVTELCAATGLSHANASKHLLVLSETGFLARRTEGTRSVCSARSCATG